MAVSEKSADPPVKTIKKHSFNMSVTLKKIAILG